MSVNKTLPKPNTKPSTQHNNKRIFITGGASGLGKAVAIKYAKQGYSVCIADVNDDRGQETIKILQSLGCDAFYLYCDVTKLDDLIAAKDELLYRWQGVDIVVNNAGVAGTAGAIEDVPIDDWHWVLNINLLGVARGCQVFTPLFKQQGSGYFVNVSSAAGLMNAPQMSSYNAAKAGVISLSETLRFELKKFNIGVSVICPTFFKTNLTESMKSTIEGATKRISHIMARSKVTADDIANDIFNAVECNKFLVITHKTERKMWRLKRYLPHSFVSVMEQQLKKMLK